jgi:hypothetical protein
VVEDVPGEAPAPAAACAFSCVRIISCL